MRYGLKGRSSDKSGVVDGMDEGVPGRLRLRLAVRALAKVFWAAFCMGLGYEARLVSPLTVMREVKVSSDATLSVPPKPVGDGRFPERMLGIAIPYSVNSVSSGSSIGPAARS